MANMQRQPVSYQRFRVQPNLPDGLLPVTRPGGEALRSVAGDAFALAGTFADKADREAMRAGERDGQMAALNGAPKTSLTLQQTRQEPDGVYAGGAIGAVLKQAGVNEIDLKRFLTDPSRASHLEGIKPQFHTQLATMFASAPKEIQSQLGLLSGYRSPERQAELYRAAIKKYGSETAARKWVAPPGKSQHQNGSAYDLQFNSAAAKDWVHLNAAKFGLHFPMAHEPWHIEPINGRKPRGFEALVMRQEEGEVAAPIVTAAPDGTVSVTGGDYRPTGRDTIYGRAFDKAGTSVYLTQLDTEMRSTIGQAYDLYFDNPDKLEETFTALAEEQMREHVFPDIMPDYVTKFQDLSGSYMRQARKNRIDKDRAQEAATFEGETQNLMNEHQRALDTFDPAAPETAELLANTQQAVDARYDLAVERNLMTPDQALAAKTQGRRGAATRFYARQAEGKSADDVLALRETLQADYADGGIDGLDGEGWDRLSNELQRQENATRVDEAQALRALDARGDAMVDHAMAGGVIAQGDMDGFLKEAKGIPGYEAVTETTQEAVRLARVASELPVPEAKAMLAKSLGAPGQDKAVKALDARIKALDADPLSYGEARGDIAETPRLDTLPPEQMAGAITARVAGAQKVASLNGVAAKHFKPGEIEAIKQRARDNPEEGSRIAAALVTGAGDNALRVLSELGDGAPMMAQAGALLASGGSPTASADILRGSSKEVESSLKVHALNQVWNRLSSGAVSEQPEDEKRMRQAALAIARVRIADAGLDVDSVEADEIVERAVQEAAGATYDDGVQRGGFIDYEQGGVFGYYATRTKVLVPVGMAADKFGDVMEAITDADVPSLPAGGADMLQDLKPVTVRGGYAFTDGQELLADANGRTFVLDLNSLKSKLAARVPGAWRP